MKVLVAVDKFKGSLSAKEVCLSVAKGIRSVHPAAEVVQLPLADGGEGSLEVLIEALQLKYKEVVVRDPLFRSIKAGYGLSSDCAYIEMARSSGLQLLADTERSARTTSTIGVGDLIVDALAEGARKIYLFVGGSATNDGGAGMLQGLGFQLRDKSGLEVRGTGDTLGDVERIIAPNDLPQFELIIVTDVQNKLLGPEGASHHYARQKGASDKDVALLENGLTHFSKLISSSVNFDISQMEGTGAAGGIAVAGIGFLGAKIHKGITTFLQVTDFQNHLKDADLVITGEGKLDSQTLQGKVVDGVAKAASARKIPVVVVCGISELELDSLQSLGVKAVLPLKTPEISAQYCMQHAGMLLEERIAQYLQSVQSD